jgi:hypothetical protein
MSWMYYIFVGASTSHKPKGLHGLYRDNFTLPYLTKHTVKGDFYDLHSVNAMSSIILLRLLSNLLM